MKPELAHKILSKNKNLWNTIASEFELTRQYIWPELKFLKKYAKPDMNILDLGCGNGRFFKLLKNRKIHYTGIDNSEELIEIARKKYSSTSALGKRKNMFVVGNALDLPFRDNSFDLIYSIAVLHHIPSKELRLKFLKEAQRTLKKDGKIILTVWYLWQRKYFFLIVKYSLRKIFLKSKLDFGDLYIPWQNKNQRYHHAFRKNELKIIFKRAGFNIEKAKYLIRNNKKTNILIIGKKQ